MGIVINGITINHVVVNGVEVNHVVVNNKKVFDSGNVVTYIYQGNTYQAFIGYGGNCLGFTPPVSGVTFLGWSIDGSANVLTSLTMGSSPITLYAVCKYPNTSWTLSSPTYQGWSKYPYDVNHVFASGIDCSKYSGLQVKLQTCSMGSIAFLWSTWSLRLNAGGTTLEIDRETKYDSGNHIDVAPVLDTKTINFTQTSGTTNLTLTCNNMGTLDSFTDVCTVTLANLTLIGKTVVG